MVALKNISEKIRLLIRFIRIKIESLHIYFVFQPLKIYEYKELLKGIKFSKTDIILDIGCGNGLETILIGKNCNKIYGIDIFKENMYTCKLRSFYLKEKVNSRFRFVRIENAGFKSDFFDKVFSICVLEHIPNYRQILEETYRILKRGGQLIFSVDSMENIKDEKFLEYFKRIQNIQNFFQRKILLEVLESIGFRKIKIYPICKSDYAKKHQIKLIKNTTKFDHLISLLDYFILKKHEIKSRSLKKGLYLIIKCKK